jgi:hypothetical protein
LRVRRGGCSEGDSDSDEPSQYDPLRPEGLQARARGEAFRPDRTLRRRSHSDEDEDELEGPQAMPRTLGSLDPAGPPRRGPNQHMPPRTPRPPPSRAAMVRCSSLYVDADLMIAGEAAAAEAAAAATAAFDERLFGPGGSQLKGDYSQPYGHYF